MSVSASCGHLTCALSMGREQVSPWPPSPVNTFLFLVSGMEEQDLTLAESSPSSPSPSPPHSRSPSLSSPSPSCSTLPSSPAVSEYWQQKYRQDAAKNWNLFYRRNQTRFFKDRHWIEREFPELFEPSTRTVLEVGSGVGNFALPLAEANPHLTIYACDFASTAIDLLKVSRPRCVARPCPITPSFHLSPVGRR